MNGCSNELKLARHFYDYLDLCFGILTPLLDNHIPKNGRGKVSPRPFMLVGKILVETSSYLVGTFFLLPAWVMFSLKTFPSLFIPSMIISWLALEKFSRRVLSLSSYG
jgi:hypothetical protein